LRVCFFYALNGDTKTGTSSMISICTFTGIDAKTDLGRVLALSQEFPFLEFGVLLSLSPGDKDARYMAPSVVELVLKDLARHDVNTALHVCGSAVNAYVAGDQVVKRPALYADRVQLNFSANRVPFTVEELDKAISTAPYKIITQHFPPNAALVSALKAKNHQVLFDLSGGRGIETDVWPDAFESKATGFAGGLGPETIEAALPKILNSSRNGNSWIDMENRIRSNGYLDLDLCEAVARTVAPFVTQDDAARFQIVG
jgi:phosphoribosylanthranilate isomerase